MATTTRWRGRHRGRHRGVTLLAALTASFIAAPSTLNAARQSGGALGVAVLGSLLGHGPELSLHVPLLVATAGYLIAIALALGTIRRRPHHAPDSG